MCASRRSLSDVSSHIRGEIRALVDTSCGLTKKGYGARGASPNHPLQAAGSRTSLRPSPTARARTLQPHCRGFTSATFYSAADRHRTSNNIIVIYSHQGTPRVTPAYGMFSPMFQFCLQPAMFNRSPLTQHMSTSCGQPCGQNLLPIMPLRVELQRSKEIDTT